MPEILDCSRYQGQPDWKAVKASGVKAVILKATEGTSYKYVAWFTRESERAKAAGLHVMAYHFANPNTDPKAQAVYFARTCEGRLSEPYRGLPTHWLDIESGTGTQLGFVRAFLAELHKLTGRTPGYYSYAPHIDMTIPDSATDLRAYPLWLAAYRSTPPKYAPAPWSKITLWQNSSSGTVPGIAGRVDTNVLLNAPAPEVAPPPPPAVIVKALSPEAAPLSAYPDLFKRPIRVVSPLPTAEYPHAASNKDDIGLGVDIYFARASYVGRNRYETLLAALKGEGIIS